MKIIIVSQDNSSLLKVGGKHIHQNFLIKEWGLLGCDVFECFPKKNSFLEKCLLKGMRFFSSSPDKYFESYIQFLKRKLKIMLVDLLGSVEPQIISAQDPLAACVVIEVLNEFYKNNTKPKLIMTLHGYYTWEMFNYSYFGVEYKKSIEKVGFALEAMALSGVNHVFTVDTRISNYIVDKFQYKGTCDVVFNAIDTKPFQRNRESKFKGKAKILLARRMVLKNGVSVAIDAIAELRKRTHNFELTIVGDGPEENRVKAMVEKLSLSNFVSFVGSVPHQEISKYYLESDILLMPSIPSDGIEEATSLSMLEGMAAGNIVICSAIGGMKEIIKDGENGYLFSSGDYIQLADIINSIIEMDEDDYLKIVRVGKKFAFENHDSAKHAKKMLELMVKV